MKYIEKYVEAINDEIHGAKEYAEKYPNIIKPYYEKENQYSKNRTKKALNSFQERIF